MRVGVLGWRGPILFVCVSVGLVLRVSGSALFGGFGWCVCVCVCLCVCVFVVLRVCGSPHLVCVLGLWGHIS